MKIVKGEEKQITLYINFNSYVHIFIHFGVWTFFSMAKKKVKPTFMK